jgi:hypothetical protein
MTCMLRHLFMDNSSCGEIFAKFLISYLQDFREIISYILRNFVILIIAKYFYSIFVNFFGEFCEIRNKNFEKVFTPKTFVTSLYEMYYIIHNTRQQKNLVKHCIPQNCATTLSTGCDSYFIFSISG